MSTTESLSDDMPRAAWSPNETSFVDFPEARARLPGSRRTIYARIEDGTLPKPVKIGPRRVGWPRHDFEEAMQRIARGDVPWRKRPGRRRKQAG